MGVAEPAPSAARDHRHLARCHEVGDEGVRRVVVHGGARRDVEDEVAAGLAVPTRAVAATAGRRSKVVLVLEVPQRRLARVDAQVDRPATAAVTAIGTAPGDVCLTSEGRGPAAAIAGMDPDLHAVEEHPGAIFARGADRALAPGSAGAQ